MATNARSVIPRRLLRPRAVREHRALPDVQTVKCALHSNGQDLAPGRIAHSRMTAPATPAAKAEAKAKAKAEAKAKSKAKPAAPAIRMCRAWNPSAPAIWKRSSYIADDESECSSIDSDVDSDCSTDDETFGAVLPTKSRSRRQVSFAKDVRFQPTKQRKSYKEREHEVVKVNVDAMVNDENRSTELEFAKHKARLKAQIMKDMINDEEEGHRIAYVRSPGTSQVAEVAFYDGEDQMMERTLNPAESKKVIDKGIFKCMVQPVILRKKIKFLMDTGCGHDLISQKKIEKHDLETLVTPEPIPFQTANGVTDAAPTFSVTHLPCCQSGKDA